MGNIDTDVPPRIPAIRNPYAISLPGDRLRPDGSGYFYSGYHMDDQSNPSFGGYYDERGGWANRTWHVGPPNEADRAKLSLTAGLGRGLSQMVSFVPRGLSEAANELGGVGSQLMNSEVGQLALTAATGGAGGMAPALLARLSGSSGSGSPLGALSGILGGTPSSGGGVADAVRSVTNILGGSRGPDGGARGLFDTVLRLVR